MANSTALYHGDCFDVMSKFQAGTIDVVITDLPYGTTACAWDTVIPFEPMWAEMRRLLKPDGVFISTASQPFTSKLIVSNLDWFRYEWIWNKRMVSGILNAQRMPLKQHENVCVFARTGSYVYNPQYGAAGKRFGKEHDTHVTAFGAVEGNRREGVGYPKSIIEFPIPNNLTGDKWPHPTQKPVQLYEYLVRTYTNEGATVLDFTMGSGTTGVACVKTGREFIGVELMLEYYEIAEKRIAEAKMQPALFV